MNEHYFLFFQYIFFLFLFLILLCWLGYLVPFPPGVVGMNTFALWLTVGGALSLSLFRRILGRDYSSALLIRLKNFPPTSSLLVGFFLSEILHSVKHFSASIERRSTAFLQSVDNSELHWLTSECWICLAFPIWTYLGDDALTFWYVDGFVLILFC